MNHTLPLPMFPAWSKSTFVGLEDCQNCQLTGLNFARPESLYRGLGPRHGIEFLLGLLDVPIQRYAR